MGINGKWHEGVGNAHFDDGKWRFNDLGHFQEFRGIAAVFVGGIPGLFR